MRLTIEADEDLGAAPELTFLGAPLAVALEAPGDDAGRVRSFLLAIDSTVADGAYAIERVRLADVTGNAVDNAADAVLVVDNSAPEILNASVDPGPFSDVAGTNVFAVSFQINEPVGDVQATLGGLTLECGERAAPISFGCTGTLAAGLVDGENPLALVAFDRAGNAGTLGLSVDVDVSPPEVESVDVTTFNAGNLIAVDLVAGGSSRVVFTSEPLGSAAILTVHDGATTEGPLPDVIIGADVDSDPAVVDVTIKLPPTAAPGTYSVSARLVDVVGHATAGVFVVDLELHDDEAPCALPDLPGLDACPDFDGDGHRGAAAGCFAEGATDCDDLDPLVHLDGVEIPGDGKDNGCDGGGDLPIDETVGVFVSEDGRPDGDGTRAAPFDDIDDAVIQAVATDKGYLFAAGTLAYPDEPVPVSLLGGFNAAFDNRIGRASIVTLTGGPSLYLVVGSEPRVVVDVDFAAGFDSQAPLTLARIFIFSTCDLSAPSLVVDGVLAVNGDTTIAASAAGSTLVRAQVANILFLRGRATVIDSLIGHLLVDSGATLVGDVVTDGVECSGGELAIFHSFLGRTNDEVIDLTGPCGLQLQNTALRAVGAAARGIAVTVPEAAATVDVRGSLFDITGGFVVDDVVFGGFPCAASTRCLAFVDNLEAPYRVSQNNDFLLDTGVDNRAIDGGLDPFLSPDGELAPFIVPGSIVRDHDGDCRFNDNDRPDIGPDEAG